MVERIGVKERRREREREESERIENSGERVRHKTAE